MSVNTTPTVTAEEYLAADRAASFRSEFVNGEVFAMSGGRLAHAQLSSQVSRELQDALEGLPCIVTVADMRLQIAAGESYVYPDVMVLCGEPVFAEGLQDIITNPSVVVEVLSESTEKWDRGGKFAQYRRVASLREVCAGLARRGARGVVYARGGRCVDLPGGGGAGGCRSAGRFGRFA
jgi:Uma2 family endonuclease